VTDWLADTAFATTMLMALVLLVREPVRRQFGPAVAYGLWLIPAVRMLMPTLTTTVERTVPAAEPAYAAPLYAPPLASTPSDSGLLDFTIDWNHVVLAVWLIGAAALLIRGASIYLRQRNAVLGDSVQLAKLDGIRIVRSAAVRGPMAFGVLDRVIALPLDFDQRYDANQRRLALDHELAHHKSGDLVANHFAFVLLCLQWFNPLAWASHAAFRFDQEAACDARVLDKANGQDRAAYGQTIAMAASGRALLFAGALDRPSTLQRRLRSMLSSPNEKRRVTGKALIAMTAIAALPLTASWATLYVDVPAPAAPTPPVAPLAPQPALAPLAPVAPTAPVAPVAPLAPVSNVNINGENVTINGQTKRWQDLTPAEKEQIRRELAKARAELKNTHIDRAKIEREVREAMSEVQVNKQELARDLAEARIDVAEAMREIDANAEHIRRAGHDPEAMKAQVRASLKAVEAIDIEAITRQALAAVDPNVIAASLAAAEASIAQAEAEMERLESRLDKIDDED
jgi:beta-lactamase regulating signal transducer with metallopeptidase domain